MRDRDYLRISFHAFGADEVGVELPVLAQTAALRALVAEDIGDSVPARREGNVARARGNHARECRRHLGTERHLAIPAVGKGVRLLVYDFFRSLAPVELGVLKDARAVLFVAEQLADAFHVLEKVALEELVFGVKSRTPAFGRELLPFCHYPYYTHAVWKRQPRL